MENYYNDIYDHFKMYYRVGDEDVDRWKPTPGMTHEIMVHMRNGDTICFDDLNKSFCHCFKYERDEYGDYVMDDAEYKKAFGVKLRRFMISRRMTQKQLSDASGINAVTLSHYMNGRNLPDLRNARRLAGALNCHIEDLLELG